jgi:hypothetical protein
MEDWLTYRLSDLLLFSPRTYYRLFELHNRALWPAHLALLGIGLGVVALLRRGTSWSSTAIVALVSTCWAFVAWAFHIERYATINWAARYLGIAFIAQALLMLWLGLGRRRPLLAWPRSRGERAALALFLYALLAHPLIGPLAGRDWSQVEVFGVAPDPTAIATLGLLALPRDRPPWHLMVIPGLWCVISGATLWAMGRPDALVVPGAALLGITLALRSRHS